jgi:two-component system cell cycle response regulator DivK
MRDNLSISSSEGLTMPHALIIDDNRNNIDVLVILLQQEGVSHTAVQHLRQIDKTLDQVGTVDVVFLDLEFPTGGNGFEILETLRANPRLEDVPIIAYTVHTSEINSVRHAGFDGFVGKPLSSKTFPGQLERILNGQSVWDV